MYKMLSFQRDLEDALRMEGIPEEVTETKEGKRLLKYLRRRRKLTNRLAKILANM